MHRNGFFAAAVVFLALWAARLGCSFEIQLTPEPPVQQSPAPTATQTPVPFIPPTTIPIPPTWTPAPPVPLGNPPYELALPLLEEIQTGVVELFPAYSNGSFASFTVLRQDGLYYLWLNSHFHQESRIGSKTQRFVSADGLTWSKRADTNLVREGVPYGFVMGPREIIFDPAAGIYEGWEEYFYTVTFGWAHGIRYITSQDGLTWTVVNEPALIGARIPSLVKIGDEYHLWAVPDGDSNPNYMGGYRGLEAVRHRTSLAGGTGWGDWETGGVWATVDGANIMTLNRIEQMGDGTFRMYYFSGTQLRTAASPDGTEFSNLPEAVLDLVQVLPDFYVLDDFSVVEVGGEDWVYFTYREQDKTPRIVVSRPGAER